MPWSVTLGDGTTILTLTDNTNYTIQRDGFHAPPPAPRASWGGESLFRDGNVLNERRYQNRTISLSLLVKGTSTNNLVANERALYQAVERAKLFTTQGIGAQWQLTVQRPSETKSIKFDVLDGALDVGARLEFALPGSPIIIGASLSLICKPFGLGTAETIENYCADPSFEVAGSALVDWTAQANTGTYTFTRVTSQAKYGAASVELDITASAGAGFIRLLHRTAAGSFAAGDVCSWGCWIKVTAMNGGITNFTIEGMFEDAANANLDNFSAAQTVVTTGWVQLKVQNKTAPANTDHFNIHVQANIAASPSAVGTAYFDGIIVVKAATVPTAWVSGRNIVNHMDDDGQAHLNYIDIEDVPGDVPALLKLRIKEVEAHTDVWAGASIATYQRRDRWLEGEDGAANSINTTTNITSALSDVALAGTSDGNYTRLRMSSNTATVVDNEEQARWDFTIVAADLPEGLHRVLIRARVLTTAGGNQAKMRWAMSWTYGGATFTPASADYKTLSAENAWEILDLGTINIPPVTQPSGETKASLVLRIHCDSITALNIGTHPATADWDLDAIWLLPVDHGQIYVSKATAQHNVLVTSVEELRGVWLLNTSNVVQSFPAGQLGSAPLASESATGGTRVHMLWENTTHTITHGAAVEVTYTPRYLLVGGA